MLDNGNQIANAALCSTSTGLWDAVTITPIVAAEARNIP